MRGEEVRGSPKVVQSGVEELRTEFMFSCPDIGRPEAVVVIAPVLDDVSDVQE